MREFHQYAKYYDRLYSDKDYDAEVAFLEKVFKNYPKRPVQTILDLGCGTGGHSFLLAQRGYQVIGVDQSEEMLIEAERKCKTLPTQFVAPEFHKGDIRTFRAEKKFDAVISMFAVMSYMVSNTDVLDALKTAQSHLKPGGVFYFDAWFGPAVLTERPSDRYKIVNTDHGHVIRFVQSNLSIDRQTVDVNYKLLHISNNTVLDEVFETHTMRYFFPQEIIYYLESIGFETISIFPFLEDDRHLSEKDWNFSVVALNGNA